MKQGHHEGGQASVGAGVPDSSQEVSPVTDGLPKELTLGKGGGRLPQVVTRGPGLQVPSPSLIGTDAKQSGFGKVPMRRNGVPRVDQGVAIASYSAEEMAPASAAKLSFIANQPPAEALGLVGPVKPTPIYPTSGIDTPTINDCLFGRGRGTNDHIGNKRYRSLVQTCKPRYNGATNRNKSAIAMDIVRRWRDQNPPGRFLDKDPTTGRWSDVDGEKARIKTSQALREHIWYGLVGDEGEPIAWGDVASRAVRDEVGVDHIETCKSQTIHAPPMTKGPATVTTYPVGFRFAWRGGDGKSPVQEGEVIGVPNADSRKCFIVGKGVYAKLTVAQLDKCDRLKPKVDDLSSTQDQPQLTAVTGRWEPKFKELQEFRRVHDHCDVPQKYSANVSLGSWVRKQRVEHMKRIEGKASSLTDSRLRRLEHIGFNWAERKGLPRWNKRYEELLSYREQHGNPHVPTKYQENTALGRWVSTQRSEYKKYRKGCKCSMTQGKITKLEKVGFAWYMAL